ncbi:lipopolysaccharide biosynthesis protein [Vibrio fortis]|uniref:lipopolysaccharide biosynthesis protein n=1 Tax=Vibrio fortis TaxID=212667 RepID=UPI003EB6D293
MPLILIGSMARNYSEETIGTYIYLMVVSFLISQIVEYGYTIISTREIAAGKKSIDVLQRTESGRLIISLLLLSIVLPLFLKFNDAENTSLVVLSFISGLFLGHTPIYYYQGNMRFFKVFKLESIFSIVYYSVAVYLVVQGYTLTYLLSTYLLYRFLLLFAYYYNIPKFKINFRIGIISLKSGFGMFIYRISIYSYTSFNNIVLKQFSDYSALASYSPADKVVSGAVGFISPLNQVLLTYFSKDAEGKPLFKILFLGGAVFSSIALLVSFFAVDVTHIIFGSEFVKYSDYLSVYIFILPVKFFSSCFGGLYFIARNMEHIVIRVILLFSLLHLAICSFLVFNYQVWGLIASVYITEISILITFVVIFLRMELNKNAKCRHMHI